MSNFARKLVLVLGTVLLLTQCRKKAYDEYYGRPESLEPPIYQVLESKGNFKTMLAAIQKAGYKSILSAAGYWTLFAPHDSAFQAYFTANNINGIAGLDSGACRKIVTYCLVYNAFEKDRLDDFQNNTTGWIPNSAYKRRTAYYTNVYDGVDSIGRQLKMISSNRNNNGVTFYIEADNNNKYLPYFLDNYMTAKNLSAADYNYFYPTTPYTGFNVADAIVTQTNIAAENGVIHVINKVITALPSLEEYLGGKPEFSLFKSLFERYLVFYVLNQSVTTKYRNQTGNTSPVYTKVYNPALAYSPNNENYLNANNDGQTEGYSMFAPTNTILQNYIDTVLLQNYPNLTAMPIGILYDFVNAHLWQRTVWPSKFASTLSFLNEEARFNPATNIIDKKILSNGIFYGTNKVQEANVFTSVYGKAYLDPKYSMMITLLNNELRGQVSDIYRNYTIFMISNAMFNAAGYTVDRLISNDVNDQWRYTPPTGSIIPASTGPTTRARLLRILNMHVVPNKIFSNFSGEGLVKTYGEEYISYKAGKSYGAGNIDYGTSATIDSSKAARNGRVFYANRIMEFSEAFVGTDIELLGTPTTSPYNFFWQYLRNSTIWNNTTKEITGIANGTFYTLFIPSNAAITQAVRDGYLPGNAATGVPNFNPTPLPDKAKVANFIYYHFLDKRSIAPDGVESGAINTVLKKNNGDATSIFVNNGATSMTLTDMESRTATVISEPSTYLSNRTVILLINNYLKFVP